MSMKVIRTKLDREQRFRKKNIVHTLYREFNF